MNLKNKAVSGIFWTFSQQFSIQVVYFVVQIILARILLPAEFGLIAMLTVFIAIGTSLMDSGMSQSLIRTQKPDNADYSTVFFINLGISLLVYIILFFFAPFIAAFYNQPILSPVLRLYAVAFIIRSFVVVQTTRLTKEMNFKLQMKMQIPSVIVAGIVGIAMAYMGYSVWSLVWMNLVQTFLFAIQHWIYSGWVPSLKLYDRKKFKYHFNFGYKITASALLDTVFKSSYDIIIGKYFSASTLGFYNRSYTLSTFPSINIALALDKVTYPMFAEIHDDDEKLRVVYKKLMTQIIFWIAPMMIFASILAKPLIVLLLTAKWLPAVPYFQVLCLVGLLLPLQEYNLNILKVKGRSDLYFKISVYRMLTLILLIAVSIQYGVMALVIGQAVYSIVSYIYSSYYSGKFINYSSWQQFIDILPILFLALISGLIVYLSYHYVLEALIPLAQFVLGVLVGYIFYLSMAKLLNFRSLADFKELILNRVTGKLSLSKKNVEKGKTNA